MLYSNLKTWIENDDNSAFVPENLMAKYRNAKACRIKAERSVKGIMADKTGLKKEIKLVLKKKEQAAGLVREVLENQVATPLCSEIEVHFNDHVEILQTELENIQTKPVNRKQEREVAFKIKAAVKLIHDIDLDILFKDNGQPENVESFAGHPVIESDTVKVDTEDPPSYSESEQGNDL